MLAPGRRRRRQCEQLGRPSLDMVHRGRHTLTLASPRVYTAWLLKQTTEKSGHPPPAAASVLVALVDLLHPPRQVWN
jgi:hypothetical protein